MLKVRGGVARHNFDITHGYLSSSDPTRCLDEAQRVVGVLKIFMNMNQQLIVLFTTPGELFEVGEPVGCARVVRATCLLSPNLPHVLISATEPCLGMRDVCCKDRILFLFTLSPFIVVVPLPNSFTKHDH